MIALIHNCLVWLLSSHEAMDEILEFDASEELDEKDGADFITE